MMPMERDEPVRAGIFGVGFQSSALDEYVLVGLDEAQSQRGFINPGVQVCSEPGLMDLTALV
jgi:hypothetical protein